MKLILFNSVSMWRITLKQTKQSKKLKKNNKKNTVFTKKKQKKKQLKQDPVKMSLVQEELFTKWS